MVVTRRVPSPRSVRHLLQVTSVSASFVGKRVLYVKHGRSASSRASPRRALCAGEVQLCCERWPRGPPLIHGALPRAAAAELKSEEFFGGPAGKPEILHHPHLKPPETAVSQKCFTFSDPESASACLAPETAHPQSRLKPPQHTHTRGPDSSRRDQPLQTLMNDHFQRRKL